MSEIIGRASRAVEMCRAGYGTDEDIVRAVLKVIRVPTEAMLKAANSLDYPSCDPYMDDVTWAAAIDEALK